MAPSKPKDINLRVPTTAGAVVNFEVGDLEAHVDQLLSLDVGHVTSLPVVVTVSFRPGYPGLGRVPGETLKSARVTLYATNRATDRVCDYRFQEEVSYWQHLKDRDTWAIEAQRADREPDEEERMSISKKPTVIRGTVAAAREAANAPGYTTMQFASLQGRLHMALFAPTPLMQVRVTCLAGAHVPGPVSPYDDFFSPWRIAKMYNVVPENMAVVVQWIEKNRTALVLRTVSLEKPETGETMLHVLCAACGDPRLAKLLLMNCSRFINAGHEAHDGRTALHHLLSIDNICNPRDPRYFRCLELVDLLVTEAAAPLDKAGPDGHTVLHLACQGHRLDSKVLPKLLDAGGALFAGARDEDGMTPLQIASDPGAGLLPPEVAQVEKLLAQPVKPLITRTLPSLDRMPNVQVEAIGSSSSSLTAACPPSPFEETGGDPPAGGARVPRYRLSRAKLEQEFRSHDVNGNGWLSIAELRNVYHRYDQFGVVSTDGEMDALIESLGIASDGRVTFDEFVLLVLKMTRK